MTFIDELEQLTTELAAIPGLDVESAALVEALEHMNDEDVIEVVETVARLHRCLNRLSIVAAGVTARRSTRERGYEGLATKRGHRTPVAMIQAITGGTAADARKAIKAGESLMPTPLAPDPAAESGDLSTAPPHEPAASAWHAPLGRALISGDLTLDQHDAIRGGLGEPPRIDERESEAVIEVWSIAATQLLGEAPGTPVEDLRARARAVRDALDPAGANLRLVERYEKRSLRTWTDGEGLKHSHIIWADDDSNWIDAIIDAALRPRRGGPRFVESTERANADDLASDPRTNEQLTYDLFFDLIRAGAFASSDDVFGARQPGVRVMVVSGHDSPRDAFGRLLATGNTEDYGRPVAGAAIDRAMCETGIVQARFDDTGNPLDLGREQRLFGRAQRVMLALRDGGCRWPGCTRPPSYCEAHHCDPFSEGGRTDIDRGILLCRHHHMLLHNAGWKIRLEGKGRFVLHGPPGSGVEVMELPPKPVWAWTWNPPPPPGRPSWRTATTPAA